jgi:MFS family permease
MVIKININVKVGRIVKYFILCDLALLAGWGLIDPVFSVFIIQKVGGATLITVGIAAALYWFLRSILQMPIANFLDKTNGEKDDLHALVLGLLLAAVTAFSFTLVTSVWQLYVVQIFHSFAFALYGASWPAIFSRHLDKDRVSFDWALDSTAVGISAGVSGFLGGVIASKFGFSWVFVGGAFFSLIAALIMFFAPELVLPAKTTTPVIKDHKPINIPE